MATDGLIGTRSRSNPWDYRSLIWNFTQRDLKSRFQGTTLGWAWSFIVPVVTVVIYTVVFSLVFRAQPPPFGNGREGVFAIWFLAGLIPWNLFVASVTGGMGALLGAGSLLQKVYLPSYVPVIGAQGAVLIQAGIEFSILAVLLALFGGVGASWFAFLPWLVLFVAFSAALGLMLAVFNVYMRDLGQITAVVLQLLFFMCPIIYPVDFIPEDVNGIPLRTILTANPLAQFIIMLREITYESTMPDAGQWAYVAAWAVVMVLIAYWTYLKWGRDVSEEI